MTAVKIKPDPKKKNIAVDFDGVIHRYSRGWQAGLIYDRPIAGSRKSIEALTKKYNVIIFSRRAAEQDIKHIALWLKNNRIPYSEITAEKPRAKWYIDDQAIRFTNWPETMTELKRLDAEYIRNKLKEGFPTEDKKKEKPQRTGKSLPSRSKKSPA